MRVVKVWYQKACVDQWLRAFMKGSVWISGSGLVLRFLYGSVVQGLYIKGSVWISGSGCVLRFLYGSVVQGLYIKGSVWISG